MQLGKGSDGLIRNLHNQLALKQNNNHSSGCTIAHLDPWSSITQRMLLRHLFASDFYLFIYVAVPGLGCGMRHLKLRHANSQLRHVGSSSLTGNRTQVPYIGSAESQPLDQPSLGMGIWVGTGVCLPVNIICMHFVYDCMNMQKSTSC